MYDAPFDALTRLGWGLAAAVVVLLALWAVRRERRSARPGLTRAVRVVDAGIGVAATGAVLGFLAVLVLVVVRTLAA